MKWIRIVDDLDLINDVQEKLILIHNDLEKISIEKANYPFGVACAMRKHHKKCLGRSILLRPAMFLASR